MRLGYNKYEVIKFEVSEQSNQIFGLQYINMISNLSTIQCITPKDGECRFKNIAWLYCIMAVV